MQAPAGLWAALTVLPTDQGDNSPLLYVRRVSEQTPSFHPAKQLSAAKTLAVQGGEDREGLATHPSTQRLDGAFSHHPVLSRPTMLHKPLAQNQRDWAPGVQGFHNYATSLVAVWLTTTRAVAGSEPWPVAGCPSPAAQLLIRGAPIFIWDGNLQPTEVGCFFFLSEYIENTKYDL